MEDGTDGVLGWANVRYALSQCDEIILGVPSSETHSSTICCESRPSPVGLPYHVPRAIFLKGVYPQRSNESDDSATRTQHSIAL